MTEPILQINHLTVAYNNEPVLWDLNMQVSQGTLLAIVGPNGAGKTTLLKSIVGLIKPIAGTVLILNGSFAQHRDVISYVPQRSSIDWDFPTNVLDVVLMGLYRKIGWIRRPSKNHRSVALDALAQVGMTHYASHHIGQLSGGQQQRVFLARALVQDALIYLLDEPFGGIDMATEKTIITLLKQLCTQGKTIIVVHHDLQTLADYFDWVFLLNIKRIAYGPVNEVLMPEYICAAYGKRNIFVHRERGT